MASKLGRNRVEDIVHMKELHQSCRLPYLVVETLLCEIHENEMKEKVIFDYNCPAKVMNSDRLTVIAQAFLFGQARLMV